MKRYYRYIIYRLYTSSLKGNDITPVATVVFIMSFVHISQFLLLYGIVKTGFPDLFSKIHVEKRIIIVFAIIFTIVYYLLVYNKMRWSKYIEEFKDESIEQRRKRGIWVCLFTIGSVVILFICMITLSILYWTPKHS